MEDWVTTLLLAIFYAIIAISILIIGYQWYSERYNKATISQNPYGVLADPSVTWKYSDKSLFKDDHYATV